MSDWHNYLRGLSRDVAFLVRHELTQAGARAVYVIDSMRSGLEFDGEILGATSPSMATWLKSVIGTDWQGNGPAMMINVEYCEYLAGEFRPQMWDIANAVACHELAHVIQVPGLFARVRRSRLRRQFDRGNFASDVESPVTDHQRDTHGPEFIRLMLHVAERLRSCGRCVSDVGLLDWDFYDTPRLFELERALLPEIDALASVPLSAVAMLAPPESYVDLWSQLVANSGNG